MRVRDDPDPDHLPALDLRFVRDRPALSFGDNAPPPRSLLLYGLTNRYSERKSAGVPIDATTDLPAIAVAPAK